jgi:hypothetical protein
MNYRSRKFKIVMVSMNITLIFVIFILSYSYSDIFAYYDRNERNKSYEEKNKKWADSKVNKFYEQSGLYEKMTREIKDIYKINDSVFITGISLSLCSVNYSNEAVLGTGIKYIQNVDLTCIERNTSFIKNYSKYRLNCNINNLSVQGISGIIPVNIKDDKNINGKNNVLIECMDAFKDTYSDTFNVSSVWSDILNYYDRGVTGEQIRNTAKSIIDDNNKFPHDELRISYFEYKDGKFEEINLNDYKCQDSKYLICISRQNYFGKKRHIGIIAW